MIDDIEELILPDAGTQQRIAPAHVNRKVRRKDTSASTTSIPPAATSSGPTGHLDDFFLPGQGTVFVKTWGCSHNNSDGEYMAGLLSAQGYDILVEDSRKHDAHVWILNSCTVKGPSEASFANEIRKGREAGKTVIVAGCVPQGASAAQSKAFDDLSVIGVQQIDRVVEVVEETLKGNVVKLTRERKEEAETGGRGGKRKAGGAPLDLPKVRRNPLVEIIPINTGCLNQCTYCKTKHARGDLGSYAPEEIWRRVDTVAQEGVKEIWLTSEDTGAYGKDIGTDIVQLLWGIVRVLEKYEDGPMLRVGMTNPPYILEHLEEMVKILNHPKVFSFLHVPVQCGSDKVLDDMRRLYTVADFCQIVDTLRAGVESMTIATDVICGFPTESDADWDDTMHLLRKYRFSVLHISQFYSRPGTPAALMPKVPSHVVKARSREASSFFNSYTTYDGLLGARLRVVVTEISTDGKFYVAHDKAYRQVLVPLDPRLLGRFVEVRVVRTGKFFVEGEIVEAPGTTTTAPASSSSGVVAEVAGPALVNVGSGKMKRIGPAPVGGRASRVGAGGGGWWMACWDLWRKAVRGEGGVGKTTTTPVVTAVLAAAGAAGIAFVGLVAVKRVMGR
ncbi:hypothetical protein HDU96_000700 [Phlyctochytrium bullatum]|nr:hypothetical protein HDU96_000700 [Phlyctochytrium bullatum]